MNNTVACCISLKMIKKFLVVLGVVDIRQLLLSENWKFGVLCPFVQRSLSEIDGNAAMRVI